MHEPCKRKRRAACVERSPHLLVSSPVQGPASLHLPCGSPFLKPNQPFRTRLWRVNLFAVAHAIAASAKRGAASRDLHLVLYARVTQSFQDGSLCLSHAG